MNHLALNSDRDSFSRNIWISVSLHGAIALLLIFRAAFFPSDAIDLRNAIRVDVVGLPDKASEMTPPVDTATPATPQKAQPTEAKTQAPPKVKLATDKANSREAKETQKKALEKLKALQAIENLQKELTDKSAPANPTAKAATFKGNALANGDSLSGLERIDFDRYFSSLESAVKSQWHLPGWLSQAQLRAQAMVQIDELGQIIKRQIVKSSGNEVFDNQVLEAIDRAAPLPQPPARLKDVIALRGIIFNFPD